MKKKAVKDIALELHRKLGKDGMLRQNDPVDSIINALNSVLEKAAKICEDSVVSEGLDLIICSKNPLELAKDIRALKGK